VLQRSWKKSIWSKSFLWFLFCDVFKIFLNYALKIFFSLKAHCFWLGIICYFFATWGQVLPGATGFWTPDPQIPSPMPWESATAPISGSQTNSVTIVLLLHLQVIGIPMNRISYLMCDTNFVDTWRVRLPSSLPLPCSPSLLVCLPTT